MSAKTVLSKEYPIGITLKTYTSEIMGGLTPQGAWLGNYIFDRSALLRLFEGINNNGVEDISSKVTLKLTEKEADITSSLDPKGEIVFLGKYQIPLPEFVKFVLYGTNQLNPNIHPI